MLERTLCTSVVLVNDNDHTETDANYD
jgi:hypothetical protein